MSELPLEVTDAVLGYIDYFSTERGRRVLLSGFARGGRYRDMVARVFGEYGLPEELIFVAQLESHFNPVAVSYAHAVGMWQFMKPAGGEYDLRINGQIDERRDPEKATRAAAQFLKALYRHYGDWYLALAAYNCGSGCVDRAIQRTGFADFWELRRVRALPLATTNYVPEILAMTIMYKNAEAYQLTFSPDAAWEHDNVVLDAETGLGLVAAAIDRPVGQIREMNPALLQATAPGGYTLHLPAGARGELLEALAVVPVAQRRSARLHKVHEDDTLAGLAKRYNTAASKISGLNDGELPKVGSYVLIPAAAPAAKSSTKGKKKAPAKVTTSKKAPAKNKPATKTAAKPKPSGKSGARASSKSKSGTRGA
jgi:membrane-bound lytic murein transglycosylase D